MIKILDKNINCKGITLIALILTVIIMLILAGVALSILTNDDGLFEKTKLATDIYSQGAQDEADKITGMLNEIDVYLNQVEDWTGIVNKPRISEGMIAVKYDTTLNQWVKADENNLNNNWYNYAETASGNAVAKQWANVVTVKESGMQTRQTYMDAEVGTAIEMDDILTFWVWIPRYAYSITNGYRQVMDESTEGATGKIAVEFLMGSTDYDKNKNKYSKDYDASKLQPGDVTPMIVHPAFTFGNKDLTGIWVAKFEASGVNNLGGTDISIAGNWENYVGNRSATSDTPVPATANTVITIKPNVPSWREISTGDMQYHSMKIMNSIQNYGLQNVDSHLMKNTELGAVAYLCYSRYGNIPKGNECYNHATVNNNSYGYDHITGAGPNVLQNITRYGYVQGDFLDNNAYNTQNGILASTTGNIYGVYDLSGGSWEHTAAYLNNSNENLELYGNPTVDTNIRYFSNGKLNEEYVKYYDRYEVSAEELNNEIMVGEEILTQEELWNKDGSTIYNEARLRLGRAVYEKSNSIKGDGIYEMTNSYTYYGKLSNNSRVWVFFNS